MLCCSLVPIPWWRYQMEAFSALLAICAGNSPVTGEFPAQRPVMWNSDVFFDLTLNKWLSNQWWVWWFETPSRPLWRYCNAYYRYPSRFPHSHRSYLRSPRCHRQWQQPWAMGVNDFTMSLEYNRITKITEKLFTIIPWQTANTE